MNTSENQITPVNHPDEVPKPPSKTTLRAVQILTVVIIVVALGGTVYFREHIQDLQDYGYAAVFVVGLISNATIILPVPGLAVSSVLGGVFNPFIVGIVGGIGQALGEMTGYMAGYSGQTWLGDSAVYNKVSRWMQRYGTWAIFVLALVPNPIFDVSGIIAGALRLPWWKFLLSCAAGKVIKNVLFALAGYFGIDALTRLLVG
jgi:uncharacterized membrane protein YdjX (TVP38/TMEM64 family)